MANEFFPGFEDVWCETSGGRLHAKVGGPKDGEAVLLLHGFPQSCSSWHSVAPALARERRVVCLDLKGYGESDTPPGDGGSHAYTKRTLAQEAIEVMHAEGFNSFTVTGHDRGAQVAYRMALDYPERVQRLGILDNLPIFAVWAFIEANPGAVEHWNFLGRPGKDAESEITEDYLLALTRAHVANGSLDCFHPVFLDADRQRWHDPARLHAFAEDYRAGATTDLEDDLANLRSGSTITAPTAVLWGKAFFGKMPESPIDIWRRSFAPPAVGIELDCGHFLLEERPTETLAGIQHLLTL